MKKTKLKIILGVIFILIIVFIFYSLIQRKIFFSPIFPIPEADTTEINLLSVQYAEIIYGPNCFYPKEIISSKGRLSPNNFTNLLDRNDLTFWTSRFWNSDSLIFTYSQKCNFTKVNIYFGSLPLERKGKISISCIDDGKEKQSKSYSFNSNFANKITNFDLAKKFNCTKVVLKVEWIGNAWAKFDIKDIWFS